MDGIKLLATIYPQDVDPAAPKYDYSSFKPRSAGRAIVFDGECVALIHVSRTDYYMLPGGGAEGEDVRLALEREVREELGIKITTDRPLGEIVVYFDRWQQKQTDICYIAHKSADATSGRKLTDFETNSGFEPYWAVNLVDAIRLVRDAQPTSFDGKLLQKRDLLFLEAALQSDATQLGEAPD